MDDAYTKFIQTTDTPQGLETDRIKYLRQADTVVFQTAKTRSEIRCIFRKNNKKRDRDWIYVIPVVSNYDGDGEFDCVTSIMHCGMDDVWKTIAGILRKGDEIHLDWNDGGRTNSLLEKHGMGTDSLYIKIYRNGKYRFKFFVTVSTGLRNTAKMVRNIIEIPSCMD